MTMLLLFAGAGEGAPEAPVTAVVRTWTLKSRSVTLTLESRSIGWTVKSRSTAWTLEEDDR